jgi:hypothetical protein
MYLNDAVNGITPTPGEFRKYTQNYMIYPDNSLIAVAIRQGCFPLTSGLAGQKYPD